MTVADNYDIEKQETNGTTKVFSFNFYTSSKDFVKVILEVDGEQSVVPSTDYTIKLNTVGGNVTFTRAPASGGYIIITRETPREQETSFATSSGFPAKTVEGRFDKLTAMIQEIQDTDNRTPSFPVGTDLNVTLPLPEAGKALIWNEDEDNLENSETTFDEIVSDAISAKNDAVAAKEAAETAQGKAEDAQRGAEAAQGAAEIAQGKAEDAKTSAENTVAGFDDHADSKIGEVNTLVGQAEGYATVAENKANAAAGSANDASGYATAASGYASAASTSASNAATWAEGTDEEVEALGGEHSAKEWNSILSSSIGDATLTIQRNSEQLATFTANSSTNTTVNITVPTSASDVGALPNTTKYGASVALSINTTTYVMTAQLKDQNGNNLGSAATIDLPLESVVVNGSYDAPSKKIILTLQSGATIEIPVADLVAGLQSEITSDNMLDADLVDDSTSTNKFVSASDKTTWNGKQDSIADLSDIRDGAAAGATAVQGASVDGTSIVDGTTKVAIIPIAAQGGNYGLVKLSSDAGGLVIDSSGRLVTWRATDNDITASPRSQINRPIVPANLDLAIKSGLSTNSLTWTDAEKMASRKKLDAMQASIFGTSDTAAATAQKEVSIPAITELNVGQIIIITPTVTSTVANSTIKLNDFPAYPMKYGTAAITTATDSVVWYANYPSLWIFDGENWVFLGHGYDYNTTYSAMSVAEMIAGTATSGRSIRADYLKNGTYGVVTDYNSGASITLSDKYLYNNTDDITALTLVAPSSPDVRFLAQVNFSSGSTATTFTYPATFKVLEGCDDVQYVAGVRTFVPVANKRYQVFIENDGVNTVLFAKGV